MLDWKKSQGVNPFESAIGDKTEYVVFLATTQSESDYDIRNDINSCTEKAAGMLGQNIRSDSMYLLFEWDVVYSMLTIVVTDELKENDSEYVVKCCFEKLDERRNSDSGESEDDWENNVNEYASKVKYWIKDYLTTSSNFLGYSLVAAFHSETRDDAQIL